MGCDNFGHCGNRTGVNIGVEIGTPPIIGQPGLPQPYPRYEREPLDPIRQDAWRIADELRHGMYREANQEIRNEVFALRPHQAEHFARELNEATGGRSPLREVPQMIPTQYGMRPTGNDVLVMTNPYGREEVVKLIRHDEVPVIGVQPGVPLVRPGVNVGIDLNFHKR